MAYRCPLRTTEGGPSTRVVRRVTLAVPLLQGAEFLECAVELDIGKTDPP